MNTLRIQEMEQLEGGACAAITGGTAGGGFITVVGGSMAQGARLTWRLGLKGLAVGVAGGAIAGGICYALS